MSIIDGIKSEIIEKISTGYKEAVSNGSLPETDENIDYNKYNCSRHGLLPAGISPQLAGAAGRQAPATPM